MSDQSVQQLISAYVDHRLSPEERAKFDALLESSPEARAELEAYQKLQDVLRDLPTEEVPKDFTQRVLARVERETLLGQPTVASTTTADETLPSNRRWTISLAAFLATAALLFLTITNRNIDTPPSGGTELASDESPSPTREAEPNSLSMSREPEEEMMVDTSTTDAADEIDSVMEGPDRISVELGSDGLMKIIDPQDLKTAEIGDTVEGWRFEEDRVVVVQLTVVDRDRVLDSMQVLLSDLSIPHEESDADSHSLQQENSGFYAVYVEADRDRMTAALKELQEDMNIEQMLVSANVSSTNLNPYFEEQGYSRKVTKSRAMKESEEAARFSVADKQARQFREPTAGAAAEPQAKPDPNRAAEKKLASDNARDSKSSPLPPPPPLPQQISETLIADDRASPSFSYGRQVQLQLPESVAKRMLAREQSLSEKNNQPLQPSISNFGASGRKMESKDVAGFRGGPREGKSPKSTTKSDQTPSDVAPRLRRRNAPELPRDASPVQVLFVLTPESEAPAVPAEKKTDR